MELKRILAKDARQANEKAVALYGQDVLVISSCQVRGQTELIDKYTKSFIATRAFK